MTAPHEQPHDRLLLVSALLLTALHALPTSLAGIDLRAGETFSGFLALPSDQYQYLAWMRDAAGGDWLLGNRYTAAGSAGVVVRPFFVLVGKLAALLGLEPGTVYSASRWVLGPAAIVALDRFFGLWLPTGRRRLTAVWLAATTSGFGVVLHAMGVRWTGADGDSPGFPAGHWWTDLYLGQHLSLLPHLVLAVLLLLLATTGLVRWWRGEGRLVTALLPGTLLAVEHPFDVAVLLGWCGALAVVEAAARPERRRAAALGVAAMLAATAPVVAGLAMLLRSDPVWARILEESLEQPSPSVLLLIPAIGVIALPALWTWASGVDAVRRGADAVRRHEVRAAAAALMTVHLLLPYLPLALQRRLALGLTIPVALAAVLAVRSLDGRRVGLGIALVVSAGLGTPLNLADNLRYLGGVQAGERHIYYPSDDLRTLLADVQTAHGTDHVVLCEPSVGMVVPAFSDLRVALGHPRHTAGFADLKIAWTRFISPATPVAERAEIPRTLGADWVLLRVGEGPATDPERAAEAAHYARVREELGKAAGTRTVAKNTTWEIVSLE